MTSPTLHDDLDRTPSWAIQGVFDPEVKGQDFSYTIGLHDLGLPELHLWGSPTDGHDPGEDWAFSYRDRSRILNELAAKMVEGQVAPGSTIVEKYDQGHATVTFTIQGAGDRDALEALGIAPQAEVLPVAWTLERPPIGEPTSLSSQQLQVAFDEYAAVVRTTRCSQGAAPDGWSLPPIPRFDADERFGPRTPNVLARAAQLWSTEDLSGWIEEALAFHSRGGLMWPVTVARAIARPAGRAGALRALEEEVALLVERILADRPAQWQSAVATVSSRYGFPQADRPRLAEAAHHALAEMALGVMSLEVVADLADRDLQLMARGPWVAATCRERALPGKDWSAGAGVIRTVRKLLRPKPLHEWSEIVAAHVAATDEAYTELCWDSRLRYLTSAAGVPWSKLADLPAGREFRHLRRHAVEWFGMVEWASCLSTLLTYRAEFSAAQVATFADPVRAVVPDLERILHQIR